MSKRRQVYHTEGLTDLSTLRAEAESRLRGTNRNDPTSTTIHLHSASEACHNEPSRHERFDVL